MFIYNRLLNLYQVPREKPTSYYDDQNQVHPLSELTAEEQQAYLIKIGFIRLFKKRPRGRPGHGKNQRRPERGGRRHY